MDESAGVLTTFKLQALIDCRLHQEISSRRDLATKLIANGEKITLHGVEAWFKHVDSNYNLRRRSLAPGLLSYKIPKRRWQTLIALFTIKATDLSLRDSQFLSWCQKQQIQYKTDVSIEMIGRYNELQKVLDIVALGNRSFELFHIEGNVGIGKSHFLSALEASSFNKNFTIMRTSCMEDFSPPFLPLATFFQAPFVDDVTWPAMLRDQFQRVGKMLYSETQDRLAAQIYAALCALARHAPLALIIDDLHWADDSTLRLLAALATSIGADPKARLVIVAATRSVRATELTQQSLLRQVTLHIKLSAFSLHEVSDYLTRIHGIDTDQNLAEICMTTTQGNPLYTSQLVRYLERSNQIINGQLQQENLELPDTIGSVYLVRFQQLSRPTRELLQFLSILRPQVDLADLTYLYSTVSTEMIVDCLEEAELADLVSARNDAFGFTHPIARESINSTISDSRKAFIHHRVGERMSEPRYATTPQVKLQAAYHLLKGRSLLAANDQLQIFLNAIQIAKDMEAWDQVVEFSEAALLIDQSVLTEDIRCELLADVGSSHHQRGQPADAVDWMNQAIDAFAQAGNFIGMGRSLANLLRVQSNFRIEKRKNLAQSLNELIPKLIKLDRQVAARALDSLALSQYYQGNFEEASQYIERAKQCLVDMGPSTEESLIALNAGLVRLRQFDPQGALVEFGLGEAVAMAIDDRASIVRNLERSTIAQLHLGRLHEVAITVQKINVLKRKSIETGEHSLAVASLAPAMLLLGNYKEAATLISGGVKLAQLSGYSWAMSDLRASALALKAVSGKVVEIEDRDKNSERDRNRPLNLFANTQPADSHQLEISAGMISNPTQMTAAMLLAIKHDLRRIVEDIWPSLCKLISSGVLVTPGWPFFIPSVLKLAATYLDKPEETVLMTHLESNFVQNERVSPRALNDLLKQG